MARTVEERTVSPGDDLYLDQPWELKEQIRRSDRALTQSRAHFSTDIVLHALVPLLIDLLIRVFSPLHVGP